MTGYVEWVAAQSPDTGKAYNQPYAIGTTKSPGEQEILAAAGLWAAYRDSEKNPWQVTCTILTREATDASGQVHNRMPVFLEPSLWDWWLDPERLGQATDTTQLLASSREVAAQLTTWKISLAINRTRTIDPHDPELLTESI